MSDHLDLDALADELSGPGDGAGHLASCASCTDRLHELAAAEVAVAASLATLPDPEVPDGLAQRISAALAAEPSLTGEPSLAGEAAAPRTVTPLAPRREGRARSSRPGWLPAAAAGAVLVLGAGLGLGLLRGGGVEQTADSAATAGGGFAESGFPRSDSGLDYADPDAVRDRLPEVLAGTATGVAPTAARSQAEGAQPPPQGPQAADPTATGTADPLARLREPAGLASCLAALLPPEDPDQRPLALDYASYRGTPALAVVLPDPDPAKVSVFVVGAGCSQAADGTLFFTRLDRPG